MPRPPRPWFRFYSEIMESAKAFELGTSDPDLYFRWTWLLSLANKTRPRGYLPQTMTEIAYGLRVSIDEATRIVNELRARRFIDVRGKRFYMHDWHEWNPDSDANLTPARAKRHSGTRLERGRNAKRTRLERLDIDKDKDKEKDKDVEPERETEPVVPLVRAFERCFGRLLSPMEIENIKALEEEHPRERIDYALREAAELNKRSVRYIQRICESQERNGDNHDRLPSTTNPRGVGTIGLTPAEAAQLERLGVGQPREFVMD